MSSSIANNFCEVSGKEETSRHDEWQGVDKNYFLI
jgi:hypothetical protein